MRSGITFDGDVSLVEAYFDEERKKYYAVVKMINGIIEYPDTTAKLKIPVTQEQFDLLTDTTTQRKTRLMGNLELISQDNP